MSALHYEHKKDFESERERKVQPVLLPNSWILVFPIFLLEWLEIKVICVIFGGGGRRVIGKEMSIEGFCALGEWGL